MYPLVLFLPCSCQELHESYLTLVEGSAFSEHDLIHRARLAGSTGVMVLADRYNAAECRPLHHLHKSVLYTKMVTCVVFIL